MITGNEPANSFGFTTADGSSHVCEYGLTIRQHFAAMAMQGMVASGWNEHHSEVAKRSVEIANALINELNKNQTT